MSAVAPLADLEPLLEVVPFVVGAQSSRRVIIRRSDAAAYLDLTLHELAAVETLRQTPASLNDFLGHYLTILPRTQPDGGPPSESLDFRGAVSLLMRLHHAGFVVGASDDVTNRLRDFARRAPRRVSRLVRLRRAAAGLMDFPIVTFKAAQLHPRFAVLGRYLMAYPSLIILAVSLLVLAIVSGVTLPDANSYIDHFGAPELLLAKVFLALALTTGWLALWQLAALAGAGAEFLSGAVRLSGLSILRLTVDDTDVFMLERSRLVRYHLFNLLFPWVSAAFVWQLTPKEGWSSLAGLLAMTLMALGVLQLCPLYRSPLIKLVEGLTASFCVLPKGHNYVMSCLQRFKRHIFDAADRAEQQWLALVATITLVWLWFAGNVLLEVLLAAAPDLLLGVRLIDSDPARGCAALLMLLALLGAFGVIATRLWSIGWRNVVALIPVPTDGRRRSRFGRFRVAYIHDRTLPPSPSVINFLKEVPIFGEFSEAERRLLAGALKYRPVAAGQSVVRLGEKGDEFFIVAEGQAQVILGAEGGPQEVVDVLRPGDSFGEIALVEDMRRTATIVALTNVKMLVLGRSVFDKLFDESSPARSRVMATIRLAKLVRECPALSHLTPRQLRDLLQHIEIRRFVDGDYLIREGMAGDEAFLLDSGQVQVTQGGKDVALLGRGELVGTIALLKGVPRVASVQARGEVQCVVIKKKTFLRLCTANVFVALLVSDLADKQMLRAKEPTYAQR